jgi:hypothetical protein
MALAVAENLHFDMARAGDVFFQKQGRVAEIIDRETGNRFVFLRKLRRVVAEHHADAAAARRAFQHHRVGDPFRLLQRRRDIRQQTGAGKHRHTGFGRQGARRVLQPEIAQMCWPGADEFDPRRRQPFRELNAFGQEPIARMHRLRAGLPACRDDGINIEVTFRRRCGADGNSLRRRQNGGREFVGFRIDRHSGNAHSVQRTADAPQNFAAIGDQYF